MKYYLLDVEIPLYGFPLRVVVADNYRACWLARFPEAPEEPHENAVGSACFCTRTGMAYAGLIPGASAGTVAHEALHLAHRILGYIGHKPDYHNDEPEAYLVGWLADTLHGCLHKKPNTKLKLKRT